LPDPADGLTQLIDIADFCCEGDYYGVVAKILARSHLLDIDVIVGQNPCDVPEQSAPVNRANRKVD